MKLILPSLGIETVLQDFSIEKMVEDNIYKVAIDSKPEFYDDHFQLLLNETLAGRTKEEAQLSTMCNEDEVLLPAAIYHNEGTINHNICKFEKKVFYPTPTDCLKDVEVNIFDYPATQVASYQGTIDVVSTAVRKLKYFQPDEEPQLNDLIVFLDGIIDRTAEGYLISKIQIDAFPADYDIVNESYSGHWCSMITTYTRLRNTTALTGQWLPISTMPGWFYLSVFPIEITWGVPFISRVTPDGTTPYITVQYLMGRDNIIPQRQISNTISLNTVLEAMFECTGKTLVSNFFGINADATHPINEEYTYAIGFYNDIRIIQSYDVIREAALQDSFGKAGTAKKLLKDIVQLFNLVTIYDEAEDVIRLEHMTYYLHRGLNFVTQTIAHHVSDELKVNDKITLSETWRMGAKTPNHYESKIVYRYLADEVGQDEEIVIELLLLDVFSVINNKEYETDEYKKKFFLVSTDGAGNIIDLNSPLALNNIITRYHAVGRPSKHAKHDGKDVAFNTYSLGLSGTCEFDASIKVFKKLQPFNSVVTDTGTFLVDSIKWSDSGKITLKIEGNMVDLGTFNPFFWHERLQDIRPHVVYKLHKIDFIVKGEVTTALLFNVMTGTSAALTIAVQSYDIDGNTIENTRISGALSTGLYYIIIDGIYYSDMISKDECGSIIESSNLCNDTFYAWSDDAVFVEAHLTNAVPDRPTFESKSETFISATGEKQKTTRLIRKNHLIFVAPGEYSSLLNGMAANEVIRIDDIPVKNLVITTEDVNGDFAKIRITFEYIELDKKTGCCDDFNLDDILVEGQGGPVTEECADFEVTIDNADGTLTATATGGPGTNIYRWFLNGQFISNGSVVETNGVYGEYRVEATNTGCTARAAIYLTDPCTAMRVEAYSNSNEVNADIINPISGYTISVKFEGVEVATSLPYVALETGVYYIYAIADGCIRSDSVFVQVGDNNCTYTNTITRNGGTLEGATDASTPTFEWSRETESGLVVIGSLIDQAIQGFGMYWLKISQGACEVLSHYFVDPSELRIINILKRQDGYEFTPVDLDMRNQADYTKYEVHFNGNIWPYQVTTPTGTGYYTVNNTTGKIVTWSGAPFTNATIIVKYNP